MKKRKLKKRSKELRRRMLNNRKKQNLAAGTRGDRPIKENVVIHAEAMTRRRKGCKIKKSGISCRPMLH